MNKAIILLLLAVLPIQLFGQCPDILPTSDFSTNFCNFPFAWEVSLGENVNVGILSYENTVKTDWIKKN